jgi:hypothetical protein
MQSPQQEPVSIADRGMAAGLCAICVGVSLAVMLVLFFCFCRGVGAELLVRFHLMRAWIACMACAAVLGFVIGSEPLPELLAHFWGTAKPQRLELTLGLWAAVLAVALLTNFASH